MAGISAGLALAGGGVRDSPTARPKVAAKTNNSARANRIKGVRFSVADKVEIVWRRCQAPKPPSTTRATVFATTSWPYVSVNN